MPAPQTNPNGQIVPRGNGNGNGKKDLKSMLLSMSGEIARALPKHVKPDRIGRIALTALNSNADLQQCTPTSFLGAIVQASQLGLEVNTPLGQAYLIPYKKNCQLIIGYQGMMDLARRSGMVKAIYAFAVYDGDEFSWALGLDPTIKHTPSTQPDRGSDTNKLTHVYAVAKLEGGEPIFTVLTRVDVERYRRRSMAANNGPWKTDYEAMALKTVIRRLFRWLPKSAEMATAVAVDEAPETGQSQLALAAADPDVMAALQGVGADVAGEIAATGTNVTDDGEVLDQPAGDAGAPTAEELAEEARTHGNG